MERRADSLTSDEYYERLAEEKRVNVAESFFKRVEQTVNLGAGVKARMDGDKKKAVEGFVRNQQGMFLFMGQLIDEYKKEGASVLGVSRWFKIMIDNMDAANTSLLVTEQGMEQPLLPGPVPPGGGGTGGAAAPSAPLQRAGSGRSILPPERNEASSSRHLQPQPPSNPPPQPPPHPPHPPPSALQSTSQLRLQPSQLAPNSTTTPPNNNPTGYPAAAAQALNPTQFTVVSQAGHFHDHAHSQHNHAPVPAPLSRTPSNSAMPKTTQAAFRVFISRANFEFIGMSTLQFIDRETGGDLFGQWRPSGDCVVSHVIGPGHRARRTHVTFNQDLGYLQSAAEKLQRAQAFHVGDWHSHHQLGIPFPSSGDSRTCVSAMTGNDHHYFLLFITVITRDHTGRRAVADVRAFRYKAEGSSDDMLVFERGEFVLDNNISVNGVTRDDLERLRDYAPSAGYVQAGEHDVIF